MLQKTCVLIQTGLHSIYHVLWHNLYNLYTLLDLGTLIIIIDMFIVVHKTNEHKLLVQNKLEWKLSPT